MTEDFEGERYTVFLFTHSAIQRASREQGEFLENLGFPLQLAQTKTSHGDVDTSDEDSDGFQRAKLDSGNTGQGPPMSVGPHGKKARFPRRSEPLFGGALEA